MLLKEQFDDCLNIPAKKKNLLKKHFFFLRKQKINKWRLFMTV